MDENRTMKACFPSLSLANQWMMDEKQQNCFPGKVLPILSLRAHRRSVSRFCTFGWSISIHFYSSVHSWKSFTDSVSAHTPEVLAVFCTFGRSISIHFFSSVRSWLWLVLGGYCLLWKTSGCSSLRKFGMTSCSLVPQKNWTLGLVQFPEQKTQFRFQFHFWISKLDPVPDHYFPNFLFIFKHLGSGYRTESNLKPSSDSKNDSSLNPGNWANWNDDSNQPNKPSIRPTLVIKLWPL